MTRQLIAPPRASDLENARMSYREFLRDFSDGERLEWVNGEVVAMPPLSNENTALQVFLISLLKMVVDARQLGDVRIEPFNMKTGPDLPGRAPDILFVSNANTRRLKKSHLEGPADVVIEVISPGRRKVDRVDKYREYEKGGVREYWLLDPRRKKAEFFRLGADARFHPVKVASDGIFRSDILPGLWVKLEWLWQTPLPNVIAIAKEMKVI